MGAQWNQRGKPQYAGSYLCPDCCVGRRSARLSLLPFCQTASAFRLICLFHTFFRCGGYRAMVFAPLRCPKLFRFPFACLRAAPSACFAHLFLLVRAMPLTIKCRRRCFSHMILKNYGISDTLSAICKILLCGR